MGARMATAKESKQVRIFVSRKITLERPEKAPVVLTPGANTVDADVAEHKFVKAHLVEGASDAADAADAALQSKVGELLAANEDGARQLREALNRIDELQAMVDAFTAADTKKK